jgi:hypothetical protein
MPPKAATDVAVAALVELAVLPPLDPPEDELLQPAASTTLLTAAAAMNNWLWHKDRDAVTYSDGKSGSW